MDGRFSRFFKKKIRADHSKKSRTYSVGEKILVTGTGRSGTTFLIQLFTCLGFDTGFTIKEVFDKPDNISFAGLEKPLIHRRNPAIIKSPQYSDELMRALDSGIIKVNSVIVPVRDLIDAAESRRRVYAEVLSSGKDPMVHPGSLLRTDNPDEQEAKLAVMFHKLIYGLVKHGIPIYFLEFPRLVDDGRYLYVQLAPFFEASKIGIDKFLKVHAAVAKPDLVHLRH